jgi:hypothetical protein
LGRARRIVVWFGLVAQAYRIDQDGHYGRQAGPAGLSCRPPSVLPNPHDPATAPHRPHAALVVAGASRSAPFVMFRTCE